MLPFDLVCFDMAGTTVRDGGEVGRCLLEAALATGVQTTREQILPMMGWSKRQVFETLWTAQIGAPHPDFRARVEESYQHFCNRLERHFETQPVQATEGSLECFAWLRGENIKICLTTGFYRRVTDIILRRLDWDLPSVASDEVARGRPAPYLIFRAMEKMGAVDVRRVVTIGDTPSDLAAGKNAGCGWTLGVTNGNYPGERLAAFPNDGLLANLGELARFFGQPRSDEPRA
jgi:phosphonatase-like hydrolase